MDRIEFRTMNNSGIQASGSAAFVNPAALTANGGDYGHGCGGVTTETREDGHIYYRSCEDAKVKSMPDMELEGTGRVMDVTMTLRNVCPCRHVSVGYLVTEVDAQNNEYSRGFKSFTVEPHYNSRCCDVDVATTRFILPDDVRVDGGDSLCEGTRHFIVRCEAHYADTNVSMP